MFTLLVKGSDGRKSTYACLRYDWVVSERRIYLYRPSEGSPTMLELTPEDECFAMNEQGFTIDRTPPKAARPGR